MPMDYYPDAHPALHLVVYSVNQKGRSEPIVLENVPINEADKRSGRSTKNGVENYCKVFPRRWAVRGRRAKGKLWLDQERRSIHGFLSTISPLKSHSSICIFRLTVLVSFLHLFLCCCWSLLLLFLLFLLLALLVQLLFYLTSFVYAGATLQLLIPRNPHSQPHLHLDPFIQHPWLAEVVAQRFLIHALLFNFDANFL